MSKDYLTCQGKWKTKWKERAYPLAVGSWITTGTLTENLPSNGDHLQLTNVRRTPACNAKVSIAYFYFHASMKYPCSLNFLRNFGFVGLKISI